MAFEFAVVGLGNTGAKYVRTRHNIGFEVIDLLAKRHPGGVAKQEHQAFVQPIRYAGKNVALVKPLTFMNKSGDAVSRIVNAYDLDLSNVWIIYDEFQLPLGTLRIRQKGSDAGHNGIGSIIQSMKSAQFPRFRLGIGAPPDGVSTIDYVLGAFPPEQRDTVNDLVAYAADAVEFAIRGGIANTMSRFNGSVVPDPST